VAALDDHEFVARELRLNRAGMEQIVGGLKRLGCTHIPSHGNFVTFRPSRRRRVNHKLLGNGRDRAPDRRLRDARLAARDDRQRSENARFLAALEASL
jgi:histidinol-phosphate aminotransferase